MVKTRQVHLVTTLKEEDSATTDSIITIWPQNILNLCPATSVSPIHSTIKQTKIVTVGKCKALMPAIHHNTSGKGYIRHKNMRFDMFCKLPGKTNCCNNYLMFSLFICHILKEWLPFSRLIGNEFGVLNNQIKWTAKRFSGDSLNAVKRDSFLIFTMLSTKTLSKMLRKKLCIKWRRFNKCHYNIGPIQDMIVLVIFCLYISYNGKTWCCKLKFHVFTHFRYKEKNEEIWLSPMTKAHTPTEIS